MSWLTRIRTPGTRKVERSTIEESIEIAASDFIRTRTGDETVLDVRTAAEYARGHMENARNVDVLEPGFPERVEAMDLDNGQPVFLYCRSGNRSGHAARLLRQRGYRAFNVGGLDDLVSAGASMAAG